MTTDEMKRLDRSLATLNVLVNEVRDPRSTLGGILNEAMLDDLEYLRDMVAIHRRNAVALKPVVTSAGSMLALRVNEIN